jgi:endo-1,4-beta-xylanase
MKISMIRTGMVVAVSSLTLLACKKTPDTGIMETGDFGETSMALKDAADIPIGTAIGYTPMLNDPKYAEVAKRDFDMATFEYHMKHGAIVQNNGSLNFTNTDALVAAAGAMDIFGHTLLWHDNQNANYLKTFAGITQPAPNQLLSNTGFETGLAGWNQFNTGNPAGTSTFAITSVPSEVRTGANALKAFVDKDYTGQQWRVQLASDALPMENGKSYIASFWIKAANNGGSVRLSLNPDNSATPSSYQGDQTVSTNWTQISFNFTKTATVATRIVFDLGQKGNTYFIDDVSVTEAIAAPTGPQIIAKLETAMNDFITGTVNRYKNKVKAWDVVNEVLTEAGRIRNNANSTAPLVNGNPKPDWFVWSEYLGKNAVLKAFQYAAAADPAATLYINDYNLETNATKLDSLIKLVADMKALGARIDGIGTQMHISWNTNYAGIDRMFQKLAQTGLKIRISELDVRSVGTSAAGKPTPQLLGYQANMFKYVVSSYLKHVPKAQQAGITVWGVNDKNSWLYNSGKEYPLLYDDNYNKKPAYAAFLQALKG